MVVKGATPKISKTFNILHEPAAVNFSFYSEEEIRKISVKAITDPVAFDSFNHPVVGGLYDPCLGPTEPSHGNCSTCGLSSTHCVGHMGHIELRVPVYNPLLFGTMFKLLKMKCLSCHNFRMRAEKVRVFRTKLLLLEANMVEEAGNLDAKLLGHNGKEESPEEQQVRTDKVLSKFEREAIARLSETRSSAVQASDPWDSRRLVSSQRSNLHMQSHARQVWKAVVLDFMKSNPAKSCDNCGAPVHKFRKDGVVKIFRMPLSKKDKMAQAKKGTSVSPAFAFESSKGSKMADDEEVKDGSSASESDDSDVGGLNDQSSDDSDSDGEEEGNQKPGASRAVATGANKGVYLPVVEVEQQLAMLWKNEKDICNRIWGKAPVISSTNLSASNGVGYHAFFLRVLPVPPSRFRPPTVMGGINFEHPQNVALTKVLNLNSRIASRFSIQDKEKNSNPYTSSATPLEGALNDWIQLQETINNFLDSSTASGFRGRDIAPGVRQLLEKKQGLFRQNMMGKRVNYAARSVISPDPYIGTDEVGVPVRFATKLTYPEPVTENNCKELAELVRNGPDCWPGAHFIESDNGRLTDLHKRSKRQRADLANSLENFHVSAIREERALEASKGAGTGEEGASDVLKQRQNQQQAPLSLHRKMRVWRHLRSGDVMLANRQPTLHKPSIMAHKVRVINNQNMQTIRLHYANCNTYNADFDGDEINLHFPQSELARAEAFEVAYTNHQYCSPTNGEPLRGLIQDHVGMGVMLTKKNTFLNRDEYTQMVYAALAAMNVTHKNDIPMLPPAILKPKKMWTGKQVISTMIMHLAGTTESAGLFSMGPGKGKVPLTAWTEYNPVLDDDNAAIAALGEKKFNKIRKKSLSLIGGIDGPLGPTQLIIRQGEHCNGVMDKAQIGASTYGLVHSVHELYGPTAAGELLSALGRLLTFCAQKWGHTCAIEDLVLTPAAEIKRRATIEKSVVSGVKVAAEFAGVPKYAKGDSTNPEIESKVALSLHRHVRDGEASTSDRMEAALDQAMVNVNSATTTSIISDCLPAGQRKPFPENCFSLMVFTGAKGSLVNHTQVSCALGQQTLEGRRVPRMISGKSLPCFSAFDPTPRAGGYVSDRFLTGVRPQEYYFHCMAGREGLVDTAVKTSRSGYLQRCLVKHLESLSVAYDRTVRSSDGSVVQFLYGEDGLDPLETRYLDGSEKTLKFLFQNMIPLCKRLRVGPGAGNLVIADEDSEAAERDNPNAVDGIEAPKRHIEVARAKSLMKATPKSSDPKAIALELLGKGMVVQARRVRAGVKKLPLHDTERLLMSLEATPSRAIVSKVRAGEGEEAPTVDLVFASDGAKVKKFPIWTVVQVPASGVRSNKNGDDDDEDNATFEMDDATIPLVVPDTPEPVMWQLGPDQFLGSINEKLQEKVDSYISNNPNHLIQDSDDGKSLSQLLWVKYLRSLAPPGENVGALAAQSIGEPSTQMTLNTFHLAGHGGGNVTLGIPRLRELLMTASRSISTPSMVLPLRPEVSEKAAETIRASLNKLDLLELLRARDGIVVKEVLCRRSPGDGRMLEGSDATEQVQRGSKGGQWYRRYKLRLNLQSLAAIKEEFRIDLEHIGAAVGNHFLSKLLREITAELRRSGESMFFSLAKAASSGADAADKEDNDEEDGFQSKAARNDSSDEDEDDDVDANGDSGNIKLGRKQEIDGYDDDEEDLEVEEEKEKPVAEENDNSSVSSGESLSAMEIENNDRQKSKKSAGSGREQIQCDVPSRISTHSCFVSCKAYSEAPGASGPVLPLEDCAFVEIVLQFPASAKKLLMVGIAEGVVAKTVVKATKGISATYLNRPKADSPLTITTDGCNFVAAWKRSKYVDVNHMKSNDVGAILDAYGVEAARAAIVREINGVFGAYHIDVDQRHLGLVADYMTFAGDYRPLNRSGIEGNTSPFLRMTFETSSNFLMASALHGEREPMESPSARIAMGQVIETGTGCFDVLVPSK